MTLADGAAGAARPDAEHRPIAAAVLPCLATTTMALDAGFSSELCPEHYGGDELSVMAPNRDHIRGLLRFEPSSAASREVL